PGRNTAIGGVGDFRREPRTRKGGLKPPLKIPILHGGEDVKELPAASQHSDMDATSGNDHGQ
ncbi:hypothetical protein, partial [Rhizobium sullae]|uniref:hypothetical protein n=1 Tax=Rhizobium sullae TaxID=50338 RepID=UPI001ADEF9E0